MKRAEDVHPEHPLKSGVGYLNKRIKRVDARVVYNREKPISQAAHNVKGTLKAIGIGDIGFDRDDILLRPADLPVEREDNEPALCESFHRGTSHSTASAGHKYITRHISTPAQWSISCWIICAVKPIYVFILGFIARSTYFTLIFL